MISLHFRNSPAKSFLVFQFSDLSTNFSFQSILSTCHTFLLSSRNRLLLKFCLKLFYCILAGVCWGWRAHAGFHSEGAFVHWSVTRFSGIRRHGPPCLLLQITPFKNLLYPKMQLRNGIDLPIRNCCIKSRRLQSGIVHTKTLAHIVRNLTVKYAFTYKFPLQ